ncbi:MAG: hypothetical protein OXC62_06250 [Aestuariivita sp.]|nr:hypothetical protein [Aestuariivita sp.]
MYDWQTLWSISGPELPEKPTWITENIHIRPATAEETGAKPFSLNPTLEVPGRLYIAHYPPRDEVQGSHRMQINTNTEKEDQAIKETENICEKLTASLSLIVSGMPYFAQFLKIKRKDQDYEHSAWSGTMKISPLETPSPLDKIKLKSSLNLSQLIQDDTTANNAFLHLSTAWQLQATSGAKPLQRSILQHYVLSVEAIVNGFMSKIRKEKNDEIKLKEEKFSKEFSDNLPKRTNKAREIRNASNELRKISLLNMIPSIDNTSDALSISDEFCATAKKLYRFRSRNLSHPGKDQRNEIEHWLNSGETYELCLADKVARTFLLAYAKHHSNSR